MKKGMRRSMVCLVPFAAAGFFAFCAAAAEPTYVEVPADAPDAGMARAVSDTPIWWRIDASGGQLVVGAIEDPADQFGDRDTGLGNWEPYTSVVGDNVFLIAKGTFAADGTFENQNFAVVFQPAAGGDPKVSYAFYADNGEPFTGQINLSRQNGNPPRVAGDKRPGATRFMVGAETSCGQLPPFQSDNRWGNNPIYRDNNRYGVEQIFDLGADLTPTPATKAWDFVYGPYEAASLGPGADTPQCSRFGGRMEFLDNGNIVVVIDDKTALLPGSFWTTATSWWSSTTRPRYCRAAAASPPPSPSCSRTARL